MSAERAATQELGAHVLADLDAILRKYKALGDRALAQMRDSDVFWAPDAESNSAAVIVKHLYGNMRSRWVDFLTTDGEKPDRRRDEEFEMSSDSTRAEVLAWWEQGWSYVFAALVTLRPDDLLRAVTIRGETHTVLEALHLALAHYTQHVGQIVWIAKSRRGAAWETLSVPRRRS